jgi:hypothetical protein
MSNITIDGLGTEKLTVSSSSVALASIPTSAHRAIISVDVADIHMENDAGAATTNDYKVQNGSHIDLTDNRYNLSKFRFIRAGSSDATLYIQYYN